MEAVFAYLMLDAGMDFSFEMERPGGEVVAIDYAAPDIKGFAISAKALGSQVEYVVENVYDLSKDEHGSFDILLILGVLNRLRNPLLAFDVIR